MICQEYNRIGGYIGMHPKTINMDKKLLKYPEKANF